MRKKKKKAGTRMVYLWSIISSMLVGTGEPFNFSESRGVVVMRVEVSSGTNDKLINEFDLVLNQRREKEAVTSNDAVRTCEAKMGAASTSALHGSRVGRGLQLAPVGGPRPPPPRWRRASGRLQRSRYGGSSAHP
ncbi:hypothetical protein MUK42_08073 [Musa troglodytarum]|uniref:Uncharacterized protein n=1 Tax=Musa troglodytarum TaxID=320322 RepID=A0A9E7KW37_9LILI|nr:hypothetical protein MUK42_08073 [Musa troglodytarum]